MKCRLLLNACKDIGLAVNVGKTKYLDIKHHQGVVVNRLAWKSLYYPDSRTGIA